MASIRHSIEIDAPVSAVRAVVATAQGLCQWWAEDVQAAADTVELGFFGRSTVYRLRSERRGPEDLVSWGCETGKEWAGTRLSFQLEPLSQRTRLHFEHSDWAGETPYFVSCNTTWGALLFRLKAAAEGKKPGPLFSRDGMAY